MPKKPEPATLSAYLLQEARRFILYPSRVRRTKTNLFLVKVVDRHSGKLLEWRKTFAPQRQEAAASDELWSDPQVLDQLYCRELLGNVPGIVERTLQMHNMTLVGFDAESHVYLRQAANCYVFGLPEATIAMSRSALEAALKARVAPIYGESVVEEAALTKLISLADRARLLPPGIGPLAEKVRLGGNDVLHGSGATLKTALEVFTSCKSVLVRLLEKPPAGRAPGSRPSS